MARTSLTDVLSVGDPAQSWNFDIFFPIIPGSASSRDLTFKCMTTDVPGTQLEEVMAPLHGVEIPYAGRRMFTHSMNVAFMETSDWATSEKFRRWAEIARSWRQNSGTMSSGYWVTAQLVMYNDIPQVVRTIQLNNLWPTNVSEVQLDGGSSQLVQLSVEFRYTDWVALA